MNAESSESMVRGLPDAREPSSGPVRGMIGVEAGTPSRGQVLVWAVLTIALVLFLAIGSVTTYDGRGKPEQARITRVWSAKAETLPDVGHARLLRFYFFGAAALFIAASIAGMGIMLELPAALGPATPEAPSAAPAMAGEGGATSGPTEG